MATDPVCGMTVDERVAAGTVVHDGVSYYFCSDDCRHKFEANPAAYVHGSQTRGTNPHVDTRGMTLNWLAPVYDSACRLYGLGARFRQETLRLAALKSGQRCLDVGCGTGVLTRLAAGIVGETGLAVGIDPAPRMIEVARKNAMGINQAEFRLAAIERLPFDSGSFDVAMASLMLHHLPPDLKRNGLREVYRVLRPGGRLIVVDLDRPASMLWWLLAWPLLMMPTTASNLRGEIPAYLRDAGFEVHTHGRWMQLLTFWQAVKPIEQGGPS